VQLEEAKVAEISIYVASRRIVVGFVPELNVFDVARMKRQIGDRRAYNRRGRLLLVPSLAPSLKPRGFVRWRYERIQA
jgi:hypothetical protein